MSATLIGRCGVVVVGLIAAAFSAGSVSGAVVNYGNFNGPNLMYLNVTEDTRMNPPPLFGAPTLVGDSLVFQTSGFFSMSQAGGVDLTDGLLSTTIMSNDPLIGIHTISISEFGRWQFVNGTPATQAFVGATIGLRVVEVNGSSIAPVLFTPSMTFTNGGMFLATGGIEGDTWIGQLDFDLTAALASRQIAGFATKVVLDFDNVLATISEPNSIAFIDKKGVTIGTTTVIIPEPSTLVLGGIGLMGLALAAARRRNRPRHALAA
jgi:hypothetical protein